MAAMAFSPADSSVWKVLKEVGDTVGEGEEIVILESMKMEIPVAAATAGTVTKLFVEEGQAVEEGDSVAEVG